MKVQVLKVKHARRFVTFETGDVYWLNGSTDGIGVTDAFVRVQPPSTATDEQIETLRVFLEKGCAAEIRFQPRPRGEVVTAKSHVEAPKHTSIRETVLSLVDGANSKNPDALKMLVEETMGKVGL